MVLFAWEILQGGFFCCCSFIFILHFVVIFVLHFVVVVLHFISRLLCHVTGTPPLASKAPEGLHQALLWALPQLLLIPFCFFIYPHRRFLPYAPPLTFFCIYQGLLGASSSSLKVAGLHIDILETQTQPICLIQSNPQSLCSEEFIFKFYHVLSWITCGK